MTLPHITQLVARVRDGEDLTAIAAEYRVPHSALVSRFSLYGYSPTGESLAVRTVAAGRPDWMLQGDCARTDPEAFFPEVGGSTRRAKDICRGCDVQEQCLNYALDNNERWGIWGGTSEKDRQQLRERKPKTVCANGHDWEANAVERPNGWKACRKCRPLYAQRARQRKGAA
jgi:WhiB family redox-sensing transcriptional regulator